MGRYMTRIVYDREARREQGGKREVVAGRAGRGNRCREKGKAGKAEQDKRGARLESTPDSGVYSMALSLQIKVAYRSASARARANVDIGASKVTTRQGGDGWYEGVGDQVRTAEEEGGRGQERTEREKVKEWEIGWLEQVSCIACAQSYGRTCILSRMHVRRQTGRDVVRGKRALMERGAVRVVQPNLRSTSACALDLGLGQRRAALTGCRVRRPAWRKGDWERERRRRRNADTARKGWRAGQQLIRGLVLKAMRGQAEVADRKRERIASNEQGSVASAVDLGEVGVRATREVALCPGIRPGASAMDKVERDGVAKMRQCRGDETGSAEVGVWTDQNGVDHSAVGLTSSWSERSRQS
ncbi:hypothetical protein DFH08DRAFT_811816 [Mycena albidolilacea]|uniref:Uncharacterized protein n=1 Tax=Mycena albidolilacea TaxID=1033008 RepID=A0AAD6ZUN3_9AGAR|nr:hypothetical protein DFH08DRAFT_811816 [Mycena albidolilacea]